jgi:vancomycin resistance protein YoaR
LLVVCVVVFSISCFCRNNVFSGRSSQSSGIAGSEISRPAAGQPKRTQNRKKSVDISFKADGKNIEFKEVPLFKMTLKDEKPVEVVADGDLARTLVEKLPVPDNAREPKPARIEKKQNTFTRIIRDEPGFSIDKSKTLAALEESIQKNHSADNLEVKIVMGEITGKESFSAKMNEMGFKQLLASFTTMHTGHIDDENRNVNLAIAAEKIDGLIIPPGGRFSFNKVVGPRTEKCGFKKAGVISQGKVIPGLGGGICQVSTTLYRAILLSGAKIDERHNHSIYDGIEYAERGLDAAVAWGHKDFCFTNTLDIPILISSKAGKGSVHIEIFAEKQPFDQIVLETRNEIKHPFKVEKKKNSSLKSGETKVVHPGVHGYSIEVFRKVTSNGKTREERLSKDRYLTFNRIEEINN